MKNFSYQGPPAVALMQRNRRVDLFRGTRRDRRGLLGMERIRKIHAAELNRRAARAPRLYPFQTSSDTETEGHYKCFSMSMPEPAPHELAGSTRNVVAEPP